MLKTANAIAGCVFESPTFSPAAVSQLYPATASTATPRPPQISQTGRGVGPGVEPPGAAVGGADGGGVETRGPAPPWGGQAEQGRRRRRWLWGRPRRRRQHVGPCDDDSVVGAGHGTHVGRVVGPGDGCDVGAFDG